MALEDFAQASSAATARDELKKIARDLEKDLLTLRRHGIEPDQFAHGYHARFMLKLRNLIGTE